MNSCFQIEVDFSFQAARRLLGLPSDHPCSRRHGSTFEGTVIVSGATDPQIGWVMDFAAVEAALAPILAQLDHRDLNEEVPGLGNPTSERIAQWIFEGLEKAIPALAEIRLAESRRTRCSYRRAP